MLPFTTGTGTIRRRTGTDRDEYDTITTVVVAAGVPCTVSAPSGTDRIVAGQQEQIHKVVYFNADVDITYLDSFTDDTTGLKYEVVWMDRRYEFGLGHLKAGLRIITGVSDG